MIVKHKKRDRVSLFLFLDSWEDIEKRNETLYTIKNIQGGRKNETVCNPSWTE